MKHIKFLSVLISALTFTACSDSTPSSVPDAPEVTSSVAETTPVVQTESSLSQPTHLTAAPDESGGIAGGISIENGYNKLRDICTLFNENDVYADFEDSGLEYFLYAMPDFSAYYSIPDELPPSVSGDNAYDFSGEITPAAYYVRVSDFVFYKCCAYCVVQAFDESTSKLVYDIWEIPLSGEEPRRLYNIDTFSSAYNSREMHLYYPAKILGVNSKYIVYQSPVASIGYEGQYILNRETGEITPLKIQYLNMHLMGDFLYYSEPYTVTVLEKSEYTFPIIYRYHIPTGKTFVHAFNSEILSAPSSPILIYSRHDDYYNDVTICTLDENGTEYSSRRDKNTIFYCTGACLATNTRTDESEVFGSRQLLGRQFGDTRQDFVKTAYQTRLWSVSFSSGHYMGFVITREEHDELVNYPLLYDKRGGRLMLLDFDAWFTKTCSDGSWIYYYDSFENNVLAVLCE